MGAIPEKKQHIQILLDRAKKKKLSQKIISSLEQKMQKIENNIKRKNQLKTKYKDWDFSKFDYDDRNSIIEIICPNGHILKKKFYQLKLRKTGCDIPDCCYHIERSQKATLKIRENKFLSDVKKIDKYKDWDFSLFEFVNTYTEGLCICDKGHKTMRTPKHLVQSHISCDVCITKPKHTFDEKIKHIKKRYKDWDMSKVTEYFHNQDVIELICPKGHSKKARADIFMKERPFCRECYNIKRFEKLHRLRPTFLFSYRPVVTRDAQSVIAYKCMTCGLQGSQRYDVLCRGSYECQRCKHNMVQKFEEMNPGWDSSSLGGDFRFKDKNLKVKCPNGHLKIIAGSAAYQKLVCQECYKIKAFNKLKKNNPSYIFSHDYKGVDEIIKYKCIACGDINEKTPYTLKRSAGCTCYAPKTLSKGNYMCGRYFEDNNIQFSREKRFQDCRHINMLAFDFYLPDYNMCIEFDGEQHFRPVDYFGGIKSFKRQKRNDQIKNDYCRDNNIKLVRIPFYHFNRIEDILKYHLIKENNGSINTRTDTRRVAEAC